MAIVWGSGQDWNKPGGSSSSSNSPGHPSNQGNNNQTGQSGNNQGGQHNLKTALEKLQSQGQGNTAQAQVYKDYLSGVVSPQDQSSDKTPFSKKRTVLDDYYAGIQPTYNQSGLPSAVLDKMKGHPLYKAGMPMTPTSNMLFGYGSVFGASTGTTASSPVVQDALLNMMGQYYNKYDYNKGYYNEEGQFVPKDAIDAALANFYPTVMMQDGPPGSEPYAAFGGANYMGEQAAADLVASGKQYVEDIFKQNPEKYGGYGGSWSSGGGGWGGGYGGGYGGGDEGPGGFQYNRHAQQGIAQGPPVNPGSLQEQVNQGFLSGMGAPTGFRGPGQSGFQKKRGGIVSLLRLGE